MNVENENKGKGGATRLRDKNKKKMIDISSKCYNTEQMFTKNKQSTIIEKTVSIFLNLNKKVCFYLLVIKNK